MPRSRKALGLTIGALIGLLVLAAIALFLVLDVNAYKPRFEAAASDMMGMEVRIGGNLGIDLFPRPLVTLQDVHIRNRGTEVVSAREARIGIDFLALLDKGVRIETIVLESPRISIEKARDGTFNFEKTEEARGPQRKLDLAKVSFSDGTLRYVDKQTGAAFEAGDCSGEASRLQLYREHPGIMKNLSLAAEVACGEIQTKDYAASDLKFSVAGERGVFDLTPLTMRVFAGQGSGTIRGDFTGDVPHYRVRYSLSQFRIDAFLAPLSPQNVAEGLMDFSANLSMQGKSMNELRQTAAGQTSLRGKNLILNGRDLDREFARFESSQTFNLVDVGAFFFAGPVGVALTKGYSFASIFQGSAGRSEIRTLVSEWNVKHGVAQAQDVAMATNENRVALQGGLDFVNKRFDDVSVALIDAKGCAKVRQKIRGTFQQPVVERPNVLTSLGGPVIKLLKQVGKLFPGEACEVFYAGSVAPPK